MTGQTHDYVIVGAGSAGAVIAARLSEDPSVSVLLLEAGGPADADEIGIPAAFPTLFKTRWDWNYSTSEQKQLHSRRAYWPRMKALGGCSSMNAMIYIRGNRADYDGWRDAHGATGWGYDDVLPYFIRSEGNTRLSGPYHGQDGPLHVEDRRFTHELTHAWQATWLRRDHGHAAPADGLHYRWPDLPSLRIESRVADKLAIACGDTRWSYADFNALVTRLAAGLDQRIGAGPPMVAALMVRPSPTSTRGQRRHGPAALVGARRPGDLPARLHRHRPLRRVDLRRGARGVRVRRGRLVRAAAGAPLDDRGPQLLLDLLHLALHLLGHLLQLARIHALLLLLVRIRFQQLTTATRCALLVRPR